MTVTVTAEGAPALELATAEQRVSYRRLYARCAIRGVLLLSDSNLQVGFEANNGRDREALIAPDGSRLETRNTYTYGR